MAFPYQQLLIILGLSAQINAHVDDSKENLILLKSVCRV